MLIKIGIDPVLVTIGGLKIHWYGIMIALGLYVAIQVALREATRRGMSRDQLMNVALLAAVLGIIGGRLYYVVQNNPSFYWHHPAEIIAVWQGGMAFFGAMFGGAVAVAISSWRWHIPFWSLLDVGAIGMTIGQAIGRIGNIINGDIVGYKTNGWGFEYTNPNTFGPLNVPVQPASLYELLISLALFVLLWNLRTRVHPDGMLAMIYIVLYSASQFFIFFLRDNIVVLGGLKQAQVTALVVIALTLPVIAYLLRTERLAGPREVQPAEARPTAEEVPG
ncbi:MAG: prolipoprotein diacylglyceryl transferase [Chloroflexota bacterium]|nr:MAG: prolipoprotein diacylglyceryl transferase [Chloroflexota bacterium]TMD87325.1 MAG: prolipoprotein diacylglyceryl transferase [Chloroflexota bacterium]